MVAETAQQKAQREWNERATRDANRREQGVGVKWEEPLNPNQPYVDGVQKETGSYLQQEPYDPFNPERGGPVGNYGWGAGPAFGGKGAEIEKNLREQDKNTPELQELLDQHDQRKQQQQQQGQQQGQGQPQEQGQAGQSFSLGQVPSHMKGKGTPWGAPPSTGGKGLGGTVAPTTQELSRQGPDFQSGGNPFAAIAQNLGVEGSRPTQGQAPPNTGGKGQQLTNEHQRRQQAAPQYSRQTGSRGRQQRGPLANMNAKKAPMGGGSGGSNE
jgi:hypothetical protein